MSADKKKIRVGLLLNGTDLDAWAFRMIETIKTSDYAEIALVVIRNEGAAKKQKPFLRRLADNIKSGTLFDNVMSRMLQGTERFLVGRQRRLPDAFAKIDGDKLLAGVEIIRVNPRALVFSDYIEGEELAAVQSHNVDVFIRLGFRILRGGILNAARYGVWSFHHGDNYVNRGGPAGYWEVMQSWPETGSVLQILSEDLDNGQVLYRSFSCTLPASLQDSRSQFYWKSQAFVPRKLRELHAVGGEEFLATMRRENEHLQFYDRRLYKTPTNWERFVLVWKKLLQKFVVKYNELFILKQWILLYDLRPNISTSLWRFKRILPPKDRFWADPFVVVRDGKHYVFIEELTYATDKGVISVLVLNKDGSFTKPVTVIEEPHHLSYPFIFQYEGADYMIPESASNRTIDLYKCEEFPYKWKREKTLMSGCSAADSTLLYRNGKWWLFASLVETPGASSWDELFIFHSDSPLSTNWTPHPKNPVVSDVKSARPAGRIFERNGHVYRPSQNSSHHYGYGFNVCEITKLTETEYEEKIVSAVEPHWDRNIIACHTINHESGVTVADAMLRRWSDEFRGQLARGKLRHAIGSDRASTSLAS